MKPFRSLQDVLAFAADHAPSHAAQTALRGEKSGVVHARHINGWFVWAASEHGKVWLGQVIAEESPSAARYRMEWT